MDEGLDPLAVCSLDGDTLAERIASVRRRLVPSVRGKEPIPNGLAIELVAAPGVEGFVDQWIELERACCGGLDWRRAPSRFADGVRVEIGGAAADAAVFAALPTLAPEAGAPA